MTEVEWLTSTDPWAMLAYVTRSPPITGQLLRQPASDRKLRLFACACQAAFERKHNFAYDVASRTDGQRDDFARHYLDVPALARCWARPGTTSGNPLLPADALRRRDAAPDLVAHLLRDIIGPPYRPVQFRAEKGTGFTPYEPWLTVTALALARAAYEERLPDGTLDPVRLAILADALEEVGCDSEEMLRHLRGLECCSPDPWPPHDFSRGYGLACPLHGPHVPGCWALDCILGRF